MFMYPIPILLSITITNTVLPHGYEYEIETSNHFLFDNTSLDMDLVLPPFHHPVVNTGHWIPPSRFRFLEYWTHVHSSTHPGLPERSLFHGRLTNSMIPTSIHPRPYEKVLIAPKTYNKSLSIPGVSLPLHTSCWWAVLYNLVYILLLLSFCVVLWQWLIEAWRLAKRLSVWGRRYMERIQIFSFLIIVYRFSSPCFVRSQGRQRIWAG